jgi:3-hydroxyisobutyrate dehydrogenase-like beta-hydroxyacid dehydrogenase
MMGSGFVEALRRRGENVVVYNRTFEKAKALERFGAVAVADPREAARGAELVHIMLADDAAVDGLLQTLEGAVSPTAVIVDHSTVAPEPTAQRAARLSGRGVKFLHAPVFMAPQATREGTGVMLAAGPQAVFEAVRAELAPMAGDLWYVGERADKAAVYKLMGNEMLFAIVGGLTDMFGLARSAGLTRTEAHELLQHLKPAGGLEYRANKIANADYSSSFDLTMARKDARLMLETAERGGVALHVLPAIVRRMDEMIAGGRGAEDLAVIASESERSAVTAGQA